MSENKNKQSSRDSNYTDLGTSLGMLFGAVLGAFIWLTTDTFVFFPVFIGAGMVAGMALGGSKSREKE